jgi:DsbC/DsbD-like thiol-disulfide interchange protein
LFISLLLLSLGALARIPISPEPAPQPVVRVALVSEQSSIAPGQELWAGVMFHLNSGWHIYWLNPGDSGEPPTVQWHLPAGFRAGQLLWPVPKRLQSFSAIDYGYEDQVLLMVPVRTPADLRPGDNVNIQATVQWVVCREVCIPGRQEVALALPIQHSAAPQSSELFEATRKQLPQPLPPGWRLSALSEKEDFVLSIRAGHAIERATFFPLVPEQIEDAAPQEVSPFAQGVRLKLRKSDRLLKPIANLKGLLALPSGKTYVIDVPVQAQSTVKRKSS